jgi:hypothetical protein
LNPFAPTEVYGELFVVQSFHVEEVETRCSKTFQGCSTLNPLDPLAMNVSELITDVAAVIAEGGNLVPEICT